MSAFLRKLVPYFRQVAGELLIGGIAGLLMNTTLVLPAILLGRALDAVLALERGAGSRTQALWAAAAYVGAVLFSESARIGKRWWLGTANARLVANLRADAFAGLVRWPMERLDDTPIGQLMARLGGDLDVVARGVREFTVESFDTLVFLSSCLVALFVTDFWLTAAALAPVPFAMLLARASGRWIARRTAAAREVAGELASAIQENLAGVRVLRLFGRTAVAVRAVDGLSRSYADANLALSGLKAQLAPSYGALMTCGVVLVIASGGRHVLAGAMSIGAFVGYTEVFLRFTGRAHRVPQLVNAVQSAAAAFARFEPLLAPPLSLDPEPAYSSFDPGHLMGLATPPPAPPERAPRPAAVAVRGMSFAYKRSPSPVLSGLDLDVPAGAFVAITGPVGSGKTTLARLIAGLWRPTAGEVRVDGCAAEDVGRARIGYVPQAPALFSGTILENVLLGEAATPDAVDRARAALSDAQLASDLAGFPAGVETAVGELGIRLSGGQRQRLALARALAAGGAAGPDLLVLDDPFSAVDVDTEARLVTSLRTAARGATVVLFSHRLAAFPAADRVVLLARGRIAESGTHAELVAAGGAYARIHAAQVRVAR